MSSAHQLNQVAQLYRGVINDVVLNVREAFLDDGSDDQVLNELKQLWESKVRASNAVDYDGTGLRQPKPQPSIATPQPTRQYPGGVPPTLAGPRAHPGLHQGAPFGGGPSTARSNPVFAVPGALGASAGGVIQLVGPAGMGNLQNLPAGVSAVLVAPRQAMPSLARRPPVTVKREPAPGPSQTHPAIKRIPQLDGPPSAAKKRALDEALSDSSDDNDDDELVDVDDDAAAAVVEEGEPLNSDDDASSDEDTDAMFDADNVVVCQYDKIQRSKNKWKFLLKDGIMNVEGKDIVFSKAIGEAEW